MNLFPNKYRKRLSYLLLLIMAIIVSCDDIFVEDISVSNVQIETPSPGWQGENPQISFRWAEVPNAVNYKLEVVSPGFATNHRLIFEKALNVAQFDTTLKTGEYEWRVKAFNSASETAYSNSSFSILSAYNIETQNVSLLTPVDQYVSKADEIDFSWGKVDGAGYYMFKIKKTNWAGDSVFVAKLYSTNFNFKLDDGEYAWGVAAVDTTTDKKTDYSVRNFSVYKNPPTTPILVSPFDKDTVQTLVVNFSWHKTKINQKYTIEIYSDPELESMVTNKTIADTATYISFTDAGRYFWRVRSTDQYENSGNYSAVSSFTIQLPPNIPDISLVPVILTSPTNNSSISDKKVTFWWNTITGAEKYNLQIVSPSFSNPEKLISDQWITSNSVTIELDPGSYEWRVRANNSSSETNFSSNYSISISNIDLTKQQITLLSPLFGQLLNNSNVKLSWAKLDNNPTYHLIIKKDSWETGSVVYEINTNATETPQVLADGTYFWGVKAISQQNGSETQYSTRMFSIDVTAPEAPILKIPTNNFVTQDLSIEFSWDPADTNDSKLTYTLEIYKVADNSTIQIASKSTKQNSIAYNFDAGGNYKWRIKAADEAGNQSEYSGYRNLEINRLKDLSGASVALISPSNKGMLVDNKVTFWWGTVDGAEKYNVQIVSPSFDNPLKLVSDQWVTTNSLAMELAPGSYEWRVKASNTTSVSNFSAVSSFSIYNNDLTKQNVTLVKPLYDELFNIANVQLTWQKLNGSVNYHVLIKKDSWESGPTVYELNSTTETIKLSFQDGIYFWGIKAVDSQNGTETGYSVRMFTVDLTPPAVPLLNFPANNFVTQDHLLNFSWEPSDVTDTQLTYVIDFYIINNDSIVKLASKTTQQKSIEYNFDEAGKYKWRISAKDKAGNPGDYSEFRYFEIQ